MEDGEARVTTAGCVRAWVLAAVLVLAVAAPGRAVMDATTECLGGFSGDAYRDGGTITCTDCDPSCDADGVSSPNGSCTFDLEACANRATASCTGGALKPIKAVGKCSDTKTLGFSPAGTGEDCGPTAHVVTNLKKKGKKRGKCKITLKTRSTDKPRRVDNDKLTLICNPRPAAEACPAPPATSTTTVTVTSTSTTACVSSTTLPGTCALISPCAPIQSTYRLESIAGEKRCVTTSPVNRFELCNADADCDNDPPCNPGEVDCTGACLPLPFVTADSQILPFPTGQTITFTVTAEGAFPGCQHDVCIACGNGNAPCAGLPGCEVAGNPNGCVPRGTQGCCDQPGFILPTFFVNILGGLCSRVDQIACGTGVVNTSNPQTGDNEVKKEGDTSDPGPDCQYGTGDDPAPLACTVAGAGNDYLGKINVTIGDGNPDVDGIHYRLTTPSISTTWQDGQSPPGTCANGSAFDDQELIISQIVLNAQPTSAGAEGSFVDLNGDTCKRAGNGFITGGNPVTDGPIVVSGAPGGPARPQAYDGSVGPVIASVAEVFTGPNSPIKDIGFVSITPNLPAVPVAAQACSCTIVPGCPE